MVPVDNMGLDRKTNVDKLKGRAAEKPILVSTFITTEPTASPALDPGLYTVYFRQSGQPKELTDALRKGSRELLAPRRPPKPRPRPQQARWQEKETARRTTRRKRRDDDKDDKWRAVLTKYGITEEEATIQDAETEISSSASSQATSRCRPTSTCTSSARTSASRRGAPRRRG